MGTLAPTCREEILPALYTGDCSHEDDRDYHGESNILHVLFPGAGLPYGRGALILSFGFEQHLQALLGSGLTSRPVRKRGAHVGPWCL